VTQPLTGLPNDWTDWIGPDEALQWQGAPHPDTRLRLSHVPLVIIAVPFLIGAFVFAATGLRWLSKMTGWQDLGLGLLMASLSVPFFGIGIGLVAGPHLATRLAYRRVRYAITDRRIYVATNWWQPKLTSHAIAADAVLDLATNGPFGMVSLQVGQERDSEGDVVTKDVNLTGLADATAVYHLLQRLQKDLA